MKVRRYSKQYGYITLLLLLSFLCAAPLLVAHDLQQEHKKDDSGKTWTGWAKVSDAGHFQSGPMTIANSRHDWYVKNTLTAKDEKEKRKRTIRCIWEASAKVSRQFGHREPWEDNTLEGQVDIPPQTAQRYQYRHLTHGCDFFSDPGVYTYKCYTAARIYRLDLNKNDGHATTNTLAHVITIDE